MRIVRVTALALALVVPLVACGDDKGSGESGTAPEERRASAADVAKGLKQIESTASAVADAAGTDKAKAKQLDEQIEPVWESIEGTIKANDANAYLAFEDSFAALGKAADSGDATKAKTAADAVSKGVAGYLAKYAG
jgi:hypothetical protein